MEISQRVVVIQVASNDDVAMAQARLVHGSGMAKGIRPCHHDPGRGMADLPWTVEGSAKRHHQDEADPGLGEMLATARALQKVVDGLWGQVKERQPAVVTPVDRAVAKAQAKMAEVKAEGWLLGHKAALEALQEARAVRQDRVMAGNGLAAAMESYETAWRERSMGIGLEPQSPSLSQRVIRWLG